MRGSRENGIPGELEALDIVLHVIERGPADAGFAAVRLALAELERERADADQDPMGVERLALKDLLQEMVLVHQRRGLGQRQRLTGREELGFDAVESRLAVGPGIDRGVEGGEFDGEDL